MALASGLTIEIGRSAMAPAGFEQQGAFNDCVGLSSREPPLG